MSSQRVASPEKTSKKVKLFLLKISLNSWLKQRDSNAFPNHSDVVNECLPDTPGDTNSPGENAESIFFQTSCHKFY